MRRLLISPLLRMNLSLPMQVYNSNPNFVSNLLDFNIMMDAITQASEDLNDVFSMTTLLKILSVSDRTRLATLLQPFIERLWQRGLVVRVDLSGRYRLVGLGYMDFGPEILTSPRLSSDTLQFMERLAFLARMSLENGFELIPTKLNSRLPARYRSIITVETLYGFLDFVDIIGDDFTLNDILYIILRSFD